MPKTIASTTQAAQTTRLTLSLLAGLVDHDERQSKHYPRDLETINALCQKSVNQILFFQKYYTHQKNTIPKHPGACMILVFSWARLLIRGASPELAVLYLKLWAISSALDNEVGAEIGDSIKQYHEYYDTNPLSGEQEKVDEKIMQQIFNLPSKETGTYKTINTYVIKEHNTTEKESECMIKAIQEIRRVLSEKMEKKPYFLTLFNRFERYTSPHAMGIVYEDKHLHLFDPNRGLFTLPDDDAMAGEFLSSYMAKIYHPAEYRYTSARLVEIELESLEADLEKDFDLMPMAKL